MLENIKTIDDIDDVQGKKVIVRGSLNVPVEGGKVVNAERIELTLVTVDELRDKGAKVILIGHIGRDPKETLEPVMRYLQNFMPVIFIKDIFADDVEKTIDQVAPGSVVLIENLRQWEEEKGNDKKFAEKIASFGDIYVNEAFPNCHREHASMVTLPKLLPSYAGRQLVKEVEHLSKAFDPEKPFVFVLGGAKVETKLPLVEEFSKVADNLFIGGVLANDFLKAKGLEIGESVTSEMTPPGELLENKSVYIPEDVVVSRGNKKELVKQDSVKEKDLIYDMGRVATTKLIEEIKKAKFVLWNGPLGYCEKGFCDATLAVAKALSESNAISIVGGGDTLAAVPQDVQEKMTFVSSGGGAMLDFLANKKLPAIEALKN